MSVFVYECVCVCVNEISCKLTLGLEDTSMASCGFWKIAGRLTYSLACSMEATP